MSKSSISNVSTLCVEFGIWMVGACAGFVGFGATGAVELVLPAYCDFVALQCSLEAAV